jgi:hypothetical protein
MLEHCIKIEIARLNHADKNEVVAINEDKNEKSEMEKTANCDTINGKCDVSAPVFT